MYLPLLDTEGKRPPFLARAKRKEDGYGRYWNPYIETMPLKDIRQLSFQKLQAQLKWLSENNKFYQRIWKEVKIDPYDIKAPDDVRRLPILTRKSGDGWPLAGPSCFFLPPG